MIEQAIDSKPTVNASTTYDFLPPSARRSLQRTCLVLLSAFSILLILF